jgi:hypothetical protein
MNTSINTVTIENIIWTIIFSIGVIFSVSSNVFIQNMNLKNINSLSIILYASIYQLIFSSFLFGINLIPNVSSYLTINNWLTAFGNDILCFGTCKTTWYLGLINCLCGFILSLSNIFLIKNINSTYIGIIISLCGSLVIIIWYLITLKSVYVVVAGIIGILGNLIIFTGICMYLKTIQLKKFKLEVRVVEIPTEPNDYYNSLFDDICKEPIKNIKLENQDILFDSNYKSKYSKKEKPKNKDHIIDILPEDLYYMIE